MKYTRVPYEHQTRFNSFQRVVGWTKSHRIRCAKVGGLISGFLAVKELSQRPKGVKLPMFFVEEVFLHWAWVDLCIGP